MTADDSGARLRALYAPEGGVRATFSHKVADYVASRPDYPAALYDAMGELGLLGPGRRVADIGAGTGLFSRGLLDRGAEVFAIEPNPAMREAAQAGLGAAPAFHVLEGAAEALPLADASVDLVTAAQAFHWFDIEAARTEFLRVLTPGGCVALVWNDRLAGDPLHDALDVVFARFGGAKLDALVAHEDRRDVPVFFGGAPVRFLQWPHAHRLDEPGLLSLAFSRSYMPARESAEGREAARALHDVFARHAGPASQTVLVRYTTVAQVGRPCLPGAAG